MFTGIVAGKAKVEKLTKQAGSLSITIALPAPQDSIQIGASISINGVCLTVVKIDSLSVTFDAVQETISKTNLSELSEDTVVNFERAAKFGMEIGGHQVSGHIDDVVKISKITRQENDVRFFFKADVSLMQYIFPKGYIALNGASLTVVEVDRRQSAFSIALIPETLRTTTFSACKEGDSINVEVDRVIQAVVETTKLVLAGGSRFCAT